MAKAQAKYTITAEDKTGKAVTSAQRNLGRLKASAAAFAAGLAAPIAAVGAAITALGININATANRLNRLRRTGQDVGLVGGQAAQLGFIAGQKDLSTEQLVGGIEQLQEKILDAETGATDARLQFQNLGIQFAELKRLSPIDQLIAIQEALDNIADPNRRIGAISDLLGGGFGRLFAGERILDLARRANELGVTEDASRRQAAGSRFVRGTREFGAALSARSEALFRPLMEMIGTLFSRAATQVAGRMPQTPRLLEDLQKRQLKELQSIRKEQRNSGGVAVYGP